MVCGPVLKKRKEIAVKRVLAALGLAISLIATAAPTTSKAEQLDNHPCFGKDGMQRIEACTELLQRRGLDQHTQALAYSTRALALSLIGQYAAAISDYDKALALLPDFAMALNNRAWAKFKFGKVASAEPDVERSLQLDGTSPHAHDTRAHVRQWQGRTQAALHDYKIAMRLGGPKMIRLYQCGLQAHGLYLGPLSGILTDQLELALRECVKQSSKCDPLPPDEECKAGIS
jgi:tetratricopeptide (TPR) repeat protein